MTSLAAPGLPEATIRQRARRGAGCAFPAPELYGAHLFGAVTSGGPAGSDLLDAARLVPPVLMPRRLEKLIELGREPVPDDVDLCSTVGGLRSTMPLYVSAFGSTKIARDGLGRSVARQAGRLGIPLVIGENIVSIVGGGGIESSAGRSTLLERILAYAEVVRDGIGGVVVQQSTEDADAEVWNLVYSDPNVTPLLSSGRLGMELKVGQGAKPGLGGMTMVDGAAAEALRGRFSFDSAMDVATGPLLRGSSPGTFTAEILRNQVLLMRNNYPGAKVWVKIPPGRDLTEAVGVIGSAGADAVTVDGAEGGSGWAPTSFLDHVGLPLGECLRRLASTDRPGCDLLASGRIWEGARAAKALAFGASAAGLGRAALVAADEDAENGLIRLVECLAFELRMLASALGKYQITELSREDLWWTGDGDPVPVPCSC